MTSYDEEYLPLAQRNIGDMLDYAVNTLNYGLDEFYIQFMMSSVSKQIEIGNPTFVAGRNGCELAKIVIEKTEKKIIDDEDMMYLDKSPEYWTGWVIAYYQWKTGMSFKTIYEIMSIEEVYSLYYPYHEADISKVEDILNQRRIAKEESRLARLRKYASLTQKALSSRSGVPLRQIQLFEQGERDIHKTQADTIMALANALGCDAKELL